MGNLSLVAEQNIAMKEAVMAMVVPKPFSIIARHTQIKGSFAIIEAVYARKVQSGRRVGSTVTAPNMAKAGLKNIVESEEFREL